MNMKTILLLSVLFSFTSGFANGKFSTREGIINHKSGSFISNNKISEPGFFDPLEQADLLQKEMDRYAEIEKNGGWRTITIIKKTFLPGQSSQVIKEMKERLRASGDLSADDTSMVYTKELVPVIKKVQKQYGFKEDGVINSELVRELNVTVQQRINQLRVNIERLRTMPPVQSGTHLVANIPEFKLHVLDGDRQVFEMAIVVGKESNQTAVFNDELTNIVFSPYWNVPPNIVRNEILPAMDRNRYYLRKNNYEQTGTENGLPVIRQKPGPKNSLGLVKFVFPNNHNIYFHDTPSKSLFQIRKRTFSHGCIRLAEPAKLAQYLLKDSPSWTPEKIDQAMNAGKEQWVKLDKPVPVSIIYVTAWVDGTGLVHFREDVYGYDK